MKKGLFVFAMLFLAFNSYGQVGMDVYKIGDQKYEKGDFIGAIKDYTIAIEMENPTYKDGKKDGVLKYYHYSGSLVAEETYKDGLSHGLWTKYDISGRIRSQKTYEN